MATTPNRHGLRPVNLLLVLVVGPGTLQCVFPHPPWAQQQSESLGQDRVGPELELWAPSHRLALGELCPFLGLSFPHL